MHPLDAVSFKAHMNDILCMLCFTDDGTVQWSCGLGQIPTGFVERIVHVFRASCSISQAFSKGFGDSTLQDSSSGQRQELEGESDDVVLVKCEKDMDIIGKRVSGSSSLLWFALIGKPFTVDYGRPCLEMLHTLEQLATVLFPATDSDGHDSLYALCNSICGLLRSTSFWFGNDRGQVTHFLGSLLTFCNAQIAKHEGDYRAEEQLDQSLTAMERRTLQKSLESFQLDISHYFGACHSRVLVFSDVLKPLFAQNTRPEEKDMLMWYYSTCLTSRLRGFNSFFFDQDDLGGLRVWYRRRELVLFTNFVVEKRPVGDVLRQLQRSADAMLDAVCVVNT